MAYYLDLFTPATWKAFSDHGGTISGFRERQRKTAELIKPGDIFVCYVVYASRWCGVLRVASPVFEDHEPIFSDPDPFTIRFHVETLVKLDIPHAIPIVDPAVWNSLSITKNLDGRPRGWAQTANLRASLRRMNDDDGELLVELLNKQAKKKLVYDLSPDEQRRLAAKKEVQTLSGPVMVEIPEEDDEQGVEPPSTIGPDVADSAQDVRESYKVQATLARIGAEMNFRIWVPKSDRASILSLVPEGLHKAFVTALPLNYNDATIKTIEQIDVIWLKNRAMSRAFEVEHTTAVYSGLLRMADLLALQPNMDIDLHIVAPSEKREKVLREITRPVFSLLDKGPLYESCTYISYESVHELDAMPHLGHMNDSILAEFAEAAHEE